MENDAADANDNLPTHVSDRLLAETNDYAHVLFPVWPRTDAEYLTAITKLLEVYYPGKAAMRELEFSAEPGPRFRILLRMFLFLCDSALRTKKGELRPRDA